MGRGMPARRFFSDVSRYFDRAASLGTQPPGLLDQIKRCNSIYRFDFPVRQGDGSIAVVRAWRAEHSHHKLPELRAAQGRLTYLGRLLATREGHEVPPAREPDWNALPKEMPAVLRTLLRRCLAKDRKSRLPDIGVARLDIAESATVPEEAARPLTTAPR